MKRHPVLIPFSKEHHQGLMVAQMLKKDTPDYKGMPTEPKGRFSYALSKFERELKVHFEKEETLLFPYLEHTAPSLHDLINTLRIQHNTIRAGFAAIDPESPDTEKMDQLGRLLADHIRLEERSLFEQAQAALYTSAWEALAKILMRLE
jgi:hemerythrin-like domain-containing protein